MTILSYIGDHHVVKCFKDGMLQPQHFSTKYPMVFMAFTIPIDFYFTQAQHDT